MPDPRKRTDIGPGMHVRIVEKENQKEGITTDGIVARILTNSSQHPHGIKVQLSNGAVGRIKEIVSMESSFQRQDNKKNDEILQLLRKGENTAVEFKTTFRFDLNRFEATGVRERSNEVEKSISKTVASFMNAQGGFLLIGVKDDGEVRGLDDDLDLLDKKNMDSFKLQLKNSLESHLHDKIIFEYFSIEIVTIENKDICIVRVTSSPEPIIVHVEGRQQEYYVRVDNESKPYQPDEFYKYWQRRQHKRAFSTGFP